MGKIRSFVREDIPQIVDLHLRAFEDSNRPPDAYFEEVFFNNPWFDDSMPSLVYEQKDGKIGGFLGVISRPFSYKRRKIQAAVTKHFMVDPSIRHTMAGLKLFKKFLSGQQDLSLSDYANLLGREVWNLFKSHTVWIGSLRWKCALRYSSTRRVRSLLRKLKQPALVEKTLGSLCPIIDIFVEKYRGEHLRPKAPQVPAVDIDENTIVALLPEFYGSQFLRPEYDERSLQWLLTRAAEKKHLGKLQKVGVSNGAGEIIGWYVYYLNPGGNGRVLQIAAKLHSLNDVFDSLFYHAWQGQGNAVYGRLEPRLINALAVKPAISFSLSSYMVWMMVHSRDSELLSAIHRGDAFLTDLDGEWLVGFHGENFE